MAGIGLCGSHRTGKTTLAACVSKEAKIPFLQTTTSEVFAAHGLDPAAPMDFITRLRIQHEVVAAAEEIWGAARGPFVSDRTPIDMMAYTLADIQGATHVDFAQLAGYLDHCYQVTNSLFSHLVVVQPAIALVHEEGKAALNRAYMEHLNTLIIGLCRDERLRSRARLMPRTLIALEARLADLLECEVASLLSV